jgi:hypothetical protein
MIIVSAIITSQEKTMIKAAGFISHSSFDSPTRICSTVNILIIPMLLVLIYPVRFISFHEPGLNEKVLVFNIKTHYKVSRTGMMAYQIQ